ncbi:Uncharacterized protein FKW44_003878 [Caligus rogercresseyi]|uniref:Uncharacterized protein n=1 Tax=Caligus rogercresseyi TaxID=217165 RepID=A0A7T8KM90_CALRO|nr:Uncharacterized protein FKW44_003878 [Caligus rogercresseyi]
MKNRFTDSHQKWFRYRLATSSLFMNKSHVDPRKWSCHCAEGRGHFVHFFYFCPRVATAIKAVEGVIFGAYGVMLTLRTGLCRPRLPIRKLMR